MKIEMLLVKEMLDFFKIEDLLKSCDIGTSTVVLQKNLLNKDIAFASLVTKEDFVLWLRLLKNNIQIYALNENLVQWTNLNILCLAQHFRN